MVESLKELNKVCQKPRYKEVGNWMVRHILRDAALPITWLLLHTPVTANQVTLFSILVGIAGVFCLGVSGDGWFLVGTLLLQLWYLLDHVDGQLARYHKTASLTGRFFDFIMHHLIHGILFFGLGFYVFTKNQDPFFVVLAFCVAVSMMLFNLIHDTKYKTFFERMMKVAQIEKVKSETSSADPSTTSVQNPLKKLFSLLHKSIEMHVVMNILTFAALLQYFFKVSLDYRANIFLVYAIVVPFVMVSKLTYMIKTRQVDEHFDRDFRVYERDDS